MKRHLGVWRAMMAGASLVTIGGLAQAAEPAPAPAMDPKAEQLMRQMSDYVTARQTFRVDLSAVTKVQAEGINQEFASKSVVAVQRPNKVAMVLKSGMVGGTVVSDGKNATVYFPMMKRYMVKPAPDKISALSQELAMAGGSGFGFPLVSALVAEKPFETLMTGVSAGKLIGEETLAGVKCQHARFTQEDFDWDVWVEAGPRPLLRKIVPDLTKAFKKMAAEGGEQAAVFKTMKADMTITLDNWVVDGDLAADLFAFTPPEGTQKVDSLFPDEGAGGEGGAEEPSPLVGKAAPAFKLAQLEGGEFDVAAHKGKSVVILDFWATWCPPCRRALPQLIDTATAYKDKGVVFCAVNEGEGKDTIQPYLESQKLQPLVALDRDGQVGKLYGVEGIPQTVIIGKDGNVKVVHVGLLPNLKQQLQQELDAILAGKNPAAKSETPAPVAP